MVGRSEKKLATVRCRAKLKKKSTMNRMAFCWSCSVVVSLLIWLASSHLLNLVLGLGFASFLLCPLLPGKPTKALSWLSSSSTSEASPRSKSSTEGAALRLSKETMSWRVASALAWALEPVLREVVVSSVS